MCLKVAFLNRHYRRFSSMYSRNKASQQVTSFTLTYDQAFFFSGEKLASQHQNLLNPANFTTIKDKSSWEGSTT